MHIGPESVLNTRGFWSTHAGNAKKHSSFAFSCRMVSNWFGFSLVLVLDYFWTRFGYVADWFQIGSFHTFGMDVPNSRVKSPLRNESPIHMSQAGVRTSLMESCGLSFAVPDAPTVLTLRPELRSGPSGVLWDVFWVVESSLSWYCPPSTAVFSHHLQLPGPRDIYRLSLHVKLP